MAELQPLFGFLICAFSAQMRFMARWWAGWYAQIIKVYRISHYIGMFQDDLNDKSRFYLIPGSFALCRWRRLNCKSSSKWRWDEGCWTKCWIILNQILPWCSIVESKGQLNALRLLLKNKIDINAEARFLNFGPQYLSKRGSRVLLMSEDKGGQTALQIASNEAVGSLRGF